MLANHFSILHTHTVVEVSLSPVRGSVREGDGGARVNVSVVQGSLGGDTVSFVVSTVNGSAQSKTIEHYNNYYGLLIYHWISS